MSDPSETWRDLLSPTAIATLQMVHKAEDVQARFVQALDGVRREAFSPEEDVWSAADGHGRVRALMIDDEVLGGKYDLEEVEDVVSNAMIDASGRGYAAGRQVEAEFEAASLAEFGGEVDRLGSRKP